MRKWGIKDKRGYNKPRAMDGRGVLRLRYVARAGPRGHPPRSPRGTRGGIDVASLEPFHATPPPSKSNDDDINYLRLTDLKAHLQDLDPPINYVMRITSITSEGEGTLVVLLHHERRARERPLVLGHDRLERSQEHVGRATRGRDEDGRLVDVVDVPQVAHGGRLPGRLH